jgi:hypothetical protein
MSKRMMTNVSFSKLKQLSFAFSFTVITLFCVNKYSDEQNTQAQRLSSCMTIESNLPLNHANHPCFTSNVPSRSWLSWLSGENKSTHVHFLDLAELIHYSFN